MTPSFAVYAAVVTVVLALFGGIYSISHTAASLDGKLDRNCRILAQLDQDIRIQALAAESTARRVRLGGFPAVSC